MADGFDISLGLAGVKILCASPALILNLCARAGLRVKNVSCEGENTLRLSIREGELAELGEICAGCGAEMELTALRGGSRGRALFKRRTALFIFALLTLAALGISSLFVWQIDVEGADSGDRAKILRALEDCGLYEGCFWPGLSSDMLRSRLLEKLPELSWMGLRLSGSRAEVLIVPGTEMPEIYSARIPADIRAKRGGVIVSQQVLNGLGMKKPGDEVRQGELLISSRMEALSDEPLYVQAKGSVIAQTERELTGLCPAKAMLRGKIKARIFRFALKFGKKRYNLYFYSGKHIDGCVKIIKEYNLGAEGLFALPLSIIREELVFYEKSPGSAATKAELRERLEKRLMSDTEGELISSSYTPIPAEGLIVLRGSCRCVENIARPGAGSDS